MNIFVFTPIVIFIFLSFHWGIMVFFFFCKNSYCTMLFCQLNRYVSEKRYTFSLVHEWYYFLSYSLDSAVILLILWLSAGITKVEMHNEQMPRIKQRQKNILHFHTRTCSNKVYLPKRTFMRFLKTGPLLLLTTSLTAFSSGTNPLAFICSSKRVASSILSSFSSPSNTEV